MRWGLCKEVLVSNGVLPDFFWIGQDTKIGFCRRQKMSRKFVSNVQVGDNWYLASSEISTRLNCLQTCSPVNYMAEKSKGWILIFFFFLIGGQVVDSRSPWRLSIIPEMFWSIINFFVLLWVLHHYY